MARFPVAIRVCFRALAITEASTVPTLFDDLPEEDKEKLWPRLTELSERLAKLIPDLPSTSPVLVSGDWGSGKTTLLRAIEREVPESRRIFFEAWRYEAEALLLP